MKSFYVHAGSVYGALQVQVVRRDVLMWVWIMTFTMYCMTDSEGDKP